MSTKVLWFSRHDMTNEQLDSLKEIVGGEIELTQVNKTINSANEIKDEIEKADILAIVAPPALMQEFFELADGKPLLSALSERVLFRNEAGETMSEFIFAGWQQYDEYKIKMHMVKSADDLIKKPSLDEVIIKAEKKIHNNITLNSAETNYIGNNEKEAARE